MERNTKHRELLTSSHVSGCHEKEKDILLGYLA